MLAVPQVVESNGKGESRSMDLFTRLMHDRIVIAPKAGIMMGTMILKNTP